MNHIIDRAISSAKIKPVIMVMPDESTVFKGSFYANSKSSGKWSDFTSTELVNFIDKNFRTIADKDSRGITGHSMGGNGALRNAFLHPEIFSSVYALSPAVTDARFLLSMKLICIKTAGILKILQTFQKKRMQESVSFLLLQELITEMKISRLLCRFPIFL